MIFEFRNDAAAWLPMCAQKWHGGTLYITRLLQTVD
jgi:hypothetical protein